MPAQVAESLGVNSQPVPDDQEIEFAIQVVENPNVQKKLDELAALPINQQRYLTDANFDPTKTSGADYCGALPEQVNTVLAWVAKHNATAAPEDQLTVNPVIEYDIHAIKIKARAKTVSDVFQIDLRQWKQDESTLTMGHLQDATVPAEIAPVVRGIIGFNTHGPFAPQYVIGDINPEKNGLSLRTELPAWLRPVAEISARFAGRGKGLLRKAVPGRPLYADEIADFYDLPQMTAQAAKPRVAILEYGGRTSQQNLNTMAQRRGVSSLVPQIERYYVGGIAQDTDPDASVECDLDAQVISIGLASKGIKHDLVEINALDTEMGAGDSLAWAARDRNNPAGGAGCDVASESWGCPKWNWTPYAIEYREAARRFAALKGVAVYVATGDHGSKDQTPNITVDYYSAAPGSVAVGGTHIWTDAQGNKNEMGWGGPQMSGATGGGVDTDIPTPYYQKNVGINPVSAANGQTGRGTPDIAAVASPQTGAIIQTGDTPSSPSRLMPVGGTSCATPVTVEAHAAFVAQTGRRIGFPHGIFYALWQQDQNLPQTQRVFRDIVQGTNGDYMAQKGWDSVTGLGSFASMKRFVQRALTVQPVQTVLTAPRQSVEREVA